MSTVLVALSGGVDSTTAASFAVRAAAGERTAASDRVQPGDEVVGVTMLLWGGAAVGRSCSTGDAGAAAKAAAQLGIDHIVIDERDRFNRDVIGPFKDAASNGATLNPCVTCNRTFKFGSLVAWARNNGFTQLITGHYARIVERDGRLFIARGVDEAKDQSYVLAGIGVLDFVWFPLGSHRKDEIRASARTAGLDAAEASESMGLCFDPDSIVADTPVALTRKGLRVGASRLERLTVGQRARVAGQAEALYVGNIDVQTRSVELLTGDEMNSDIVHIGNWCGDRSDRVLVQTSAHGVARPASVIARDAETLTVRFDAPQRRVAPGQSVVCYQPDSWSDQVIVGTGVAV